MTVSANTLTEGRLIELKHLFDTAASSTRNDQVIQDNLDENGTYFELYLHTISDANCVPQSNVVTAAQRVISALLPKSTSKMYDLDLTDPETIKITEGFSEKVAELGAKLDKMRVELSSKMMRTGVVIHLSPA